MFSFDVHPPPEVIRYEDGPRRLTLRRSLPSDAGVLVDAIRVALPELRAFMPWAHHDEGNGEAAQTERLRHLVNRWDEGKEFVFHLLVPRDDGSSDFVGCVGLHPRCLYPHGMEVGYWVRSDVVGQGICTLAVRLVLLAGFRAMGLKRIQVGCDASNEASRRVIDKAGFSFEGLQRGMGAASSGAPDAPSGWKGSGDTLSFGMVPEDLEGLDWVAPVAAGMQFDSVTQR